MTQPRIERVPADYDPRYPRELSREEYERRIAPDQGQRMVAAAAAAAALAGASAAQQAAPRGPGVAERIDAVLEVLTSGVAGGSGWFRRAEFERRSDAQGHLVLLPDVPISFGNSMNGLFDDERARQLAQQLFAAYGLRPIVDHRIETPGIEATLDVFDPERRIGAKLRGRTPEEQWMLAEPVAEAPASALDDAEQARLAEQGIRVQCADLASFPVMDGDAATSTFAYLAALVAFLEEVTDGPEIDLTAILAKEQVRIDRGLGVEGEESGAATARTITYAIDPGRGYERAMRTDRRGRVEAWEPPLLVPGPGSPLLLELGAGHATGVVVEQDGQPPLRVEAAGTLCFLPPRFDPGHPYRVTLRLSQETGSVDSHLVLYGVR